MKAILAHMRFPFSFFLMPMYSWALYLVRDWDYNRFDATFLFLILHLLVYPSSNAFNSSQDKDLGSIGGLKNPPPVPSSLTTITWIIDLAAVLLSYIFLSAFVAIGIFGYILASRAYSHRSIRWKKNPISGFLTVFIFQGAYIVALVVYSLVPNVHDLSIDIWIPILAASFLIGAIYPLTQIYQFESDKADGVTTLSMRLGYKGTFIWTILCFTIASLAIAYSGISNGKTMDVMVFQLFGLPVVIYFIYWMRLVWIDTIHASFKHTMRFNLIASFCLNSCFLYLAFV